MKMEGMSWDLATGSYDAATGTYTNVIGEALSRLNHLVVSHFRARRIHAHALVLLIALQWFIVSNGSFACLCGDVICVVCLMSQGASPASCWSN